MIIYPLSEYEPLPILDILRNIFTNTFCKRIVQTHFVNKCYKQHVYKDFMNNFWSHIAKTDQTGLFISIFYATLLHKIIWRRRNVSAPEVWKLELFSLLQISLLSEHSIILQIYEFQIKKVLIFILEEDDRPTRFSASPGSRYTSRRMDVLQV